MNSLEEYTAFAATISELMRDGEELNMIENIQNSILDAKNLHHDEQIHYQNEIEHLLEKVEDTRKKSRRSASKEEYQAKHESLQSEHHACLQNISNLQEQRFLLQQQINKLKKAPSLVAKRNEIEKLKEKLNVEDQKVRLYMNTFKGLNWDFDDENKVQGYYVAQQLSDTRSLVPFSFDKNTETACEIADRMWEEIL
mmetsp:Transcript_7475/g.9237  ORF Transcript_7475/g.9237 Transcript_7475/m.9237 type:complete len:197 (-) Transcript_7475:105-695(-)